MLLHTHISQICDALLLLLERDWPEFVYKRFDILSVLEA